LGGGDTPFTLNVFTGEGWRKGKRRKRWAKTKKEDPKGRSSPRSVGGHRNSRGRGQKKVPGRGGSIGRVV